MGMKDYTLTCGEVIDNLLTMADAYEKASAGKAPNGFAFNPTDAAANIKAAVAFIGNFGQQLPRWIPVDERLPEEECRCLLVIRGEVMSATYYPPGKFQPGITHWMPLPLPPEVTT
jgi:hypothetical protein